MPSSGISVCSIGHPSQKGYCRIRRVSEKGHSFMMIILVVVFIAFLMHLNTLFAFLTAAEHWLKVFTAGFLIILPLKQLVLATAADRILDYTGLDGPGLIWYVNSYVLLFKTSNVSWKLFKILKPVLGFSLHTFSFMRACFPAWA